MARDRAVLSVLVSVALLTLASSERLSAQGRPAAQGPSGAWIGTFVSPGGATVPVVVVISEDGTWQSSDVTDFGSGTGVEIQSGLKGAWSHTSPREIAALGFGFGFDGLGEASAGTYNATLGIQATAQFNETFDTMTAVLTLGIWKGSQADIPDPLADPPDTVLPKFAFAAKRIPPIHPSARKAMRRGR
jgi:hypothetical protein